MTIILDGTKGTSTPGLYSNSTFTDTFTDGIVVDYTTGTGRISVGASDGLSVYNGGVGSTALLNLTSGGNLGLGVTPSAWGSSFKALEITGNGFLGNIGGGTQIDVGLNFYRNSSNQYIYKTTAAASYYEQYAGQHQWYNAPSGTAGNAITFTQAMTLDASGNLGVGTTSPSSYATLAVDTSKGATGVTFGDLGTFANDTALYMRTSGLAKFLCVNGGAFTWGISGGAERARIDSSGNLLVGTTSSSGISGWGLAKGIGLSSDYSANGAFSVNSTSSTGTQYFFGFGRGGTQCGSISSAGTNSTTYNTSSDYRLKENIAPMTGALSVVSKLKPCTYTWKSDGSSGQGFIAHELQALVPECVTGEKDAVNDEGVPLYQGIDTSFLIATLTAAIQEQQAIIEQLKADVAALKA